MTLNQTNSNSAAETGIKERLKTVVMDPVQISQSFGKG